MPLKVHVLDNIMQANSLSFVKGQARSALLYQVLYGYVHACAIPWLNMATRSCHPFHTNAYQVEVKLDAR